ncbi:hypothetical protein SAMN04489712_106319 [Thermomonospora echinospora]|uniref:Roadblock/LAMTOR2 domain-containing protein n=1 Tax=Thermomonospora echinospora TaxID=1992 RepID=A0A1H6B6R0_9ACTN|nr:hypothetical protein [Thermomonospora echinospora]SEG56529.1 hypothetical protein SAMN04489712_106319 [Thermomonospora echinospora]
MLGIDHCLDHVMAIPGAQRVTLVDGASGLAVAAAGRADLADQHEDAAGTTDVVRAVLAAPSLRTSGTGEDVEDIIVSGAHGYHLLTLLGTAFDGRLFLHVHIDGGAGNLALARIRMREIVREMTGS